jgi:hypothetical protein
VGKQDFPGFFGRFGRAEQITLHFGAAESPQQFHRRTLVSRVFRGSIAAAIMA